ncbi:hypothetical protein A4L30_10785 [Salmonella enterica subsp. enterica serovar Bovismorbificans]|nr:hypothetical protein [Salmonella enterica subsp. enterica serovar Bovismorbificans]
MKLTAQTNVKRLRKDIERWSEKAGNTFHKELGFAVMAEKLELQRKINRKIDRPTKFTQNSVGTYHRMRTGQSKSIHKIYLFPAQAEYLKYYFYGGSVTKFVPTRSGVLDNHGNIDGLAKGMYMRGKNKGKKKIGKAGANIKTAYAGGFSKKGKMGRKTLVVDVSQKNRDLRVVGVEKTTNRSASLGSWKSNVNIMERNVNKRMNRVKQYI